MVTADMAGNDGAIAIGGASGDAINEHDAVQDEAQGSQETEAISVDNADPNATGQQQEMVPDNFVADQFALKFRGKTIVPKTKEELLNYAQRGYNFDHRVKGLDERETKLKEQEAQYGQVAQLSQLFDQNPQFKQAVYDIYHKYANGEVPQAEGQNPEGQQFDIESSPVVRQLREKLEKMEQGYQSWEQKQATEAVEKEVSSLKEAHADEDWDTPDAETGETLEIEILKHADSNGFKSLEAAYRDLRWDNMQTQIKAKALKDAEAAKLQQTRAGTVSNGGTAQPNAAPRTMPRSSTYDQLSKAALQSLN